MSRVRRETEARAVHLAGVTGNVLFGGVTLYLMLHLPESVVTLLGVKLGTSPALLLSSAGSFFFLLVALGLFDRHKGGRG